MVLSLQLFASKALYAAHFDFDTTDNNCSILIREAYFFSGGWSEGDEIGVFTSTGICGGASIINRFPVGIAAWSDDSLTPDSVGVEGFEEGDSIYFRRWDAVNQVESDLEKVYLLMGDGLWRNGGVLILELADTDPYFPITPTYPHHAFSCVASEFYVADISTGPNPGDISAIRTPTGEVGGILVWVTEDSAMGWAYGDDPSTEEIVEGFREGESFSFSYHKSGTEFEIDSTNWMFLRGEELFSEGGSSLVRLWNEPNSVADEPFNPEDFRILSCYPNPFNGKTTIKVSLPIAAPVNLRLYGTDGRLVKNISVGLISSGLSAIPIDLSSLPSAVYSVSVDTPFGERSVKLMLLK